MTEQEEFEFRARLEAESAAPARTPLKFDRGAATGGDSTTKRTLAGAGLGVSDLGNTALNVLAYLPGKATDALRDVLPADRRGLVPNIAQWNRTRNADFDYLTEQNDDATAFNVGRAGGNIAATLPVGGVAGQGIRSLASLPRLASAAPKIERLANSVGSSGLRLGSALPATASRAQKLGDMATRATGGAITGGTSAALVNQDHIGRGAAIGAVIPGGVKLAGLAGKGMSSMVDNVSERLMQSAIKPTIAQLKSGEAATAVKTLLEFGINPTKGGVERLRYLISGLNDEIADRIANSGTSISKKAVVKSLDEVRRNFSRQVSPQNDLRAIQNVSDDFMAHPNLPSDAIPVTAAQALKQGTYKVLKKKYGQIGSAETEAQKGLARGLKEEIAQAVPGVQALNAEESRLIATLSVAERRALIEMNKNPMGLAGLAHSPASWAAFMMDKSALFKSLAARSLNSTAGGLRKSGLALENAMDRPVLRSGAPVISDRRE